MTDEQFAALLADRAAGTQGPWLYRPDKNDDWGVVKAGGFVICQSRGPEHMDDELLSECRKKRVDPWGANARRIARVPEMEAEIIRLRAALEAAPMRLPDDRLKIDFGSMDWILHNRVDEGCEPYRAALREIAAMETPNANATVRRMAKIALEALE